MTRVATRDHGPDAEHQERDRQQRDQQRDEHRDERDRDADERRHERERQHDDEHGGLEDQPQQVERQYDEREGEDQERDQEAEEDLTGSISRSNTRAALHRQASLGTACAQATYERRLREVPAIGAGRPARAAPGRQVGHRLVRDPLVQALDDRARPPAVFFIFVKPTMTQKPMKSTSTNTVLDAEPLKSAEARSAPTSSLMLRASPGAGFGVGHVVVDEPAPHFFHRDALGLVRQRRPASLEPRPRAAAQLLGTQRRDVDEQEPALDRRQRLGRNPRRRRAS